MHNSSQGGAWARGIWKWMNWPFILSSRWFHSQILFKWDIFHDDLMRNLSHWIIISPTKRRTLHIQRTFWFQFQSIHLRIDQKPDLSLLRSYPVLPSQRTLSLSFSLTLIYISIASINIVLGERKKEWKLIPLRMNHHHH